MSTQVSITYRRATDSELPRITELMTAGNLDTRGLIAANILVAIANDEIVGVNRLKKYPDGAQEIASAYVVPEFRAKGINQRLTEILRDECTGEVFVITNPINEKYIGKMGFKRLFYNVDPFPDSIREKIDWCRCKYVDHEPGIFVYGRG